MTVVKQQLRAFGRAGLVFHGKNAQGRIDLRAGKLDSVIARYAFIANRYALAVIVRQLRQQMIAVGIGRLAGNVRIADVNQIARSAVGIGAVRITDISARSTQRLQLAQSAIAVIHVLNIAANRIGDAVDLAFRRIGHRDRILHAVVHLRQPVLVPAAVLRERHHVVHSVRNRHGRGVVRQLQVHAVLIRIRRAALNREVMTGAVAVRPDIMGGIAQLLAVYCLVHAGSPAVACEIRSVIALAAVVVVADGNRLAQAVHGNVRMGYYAVAVEYAGVYYACAAGGHAFIVPALFNAHVAYVGNSQQRRRGGAVVAGAELGIVPYGVVLQHGTAQRHAEVSVGLVPAAVQIGDVKGDSGSVSADDAVLRHIRNIARSLRIERVPGNGRRSPVLQDFVQADILRVLRIVRALYHSQAELRLDYGIARGERHQFLEPEQRYVFGLIAVLPAYFYIRLGVVVGRGMILAQEGVVQIGRLIDYLDGRVDNDREDRFLQEVLRQQVIHAGTRFGFGQRKADGHILDLAAVGYHRRRKAEYSLFALERFDAVILHGAEAQVIGLEQNRGKFQRLTILDNDFLLASCAVQRIAYAHARIGFLVFYAGYHLLRQILFRSAGIVCAQNRPGLSACGVLRKAPFDHMAVILDARQHFFLRIAGEFRLHGVVLIMPYCLAAACAGNELIVDILPLVLIAEMHRARIEHSLSAAVAQIVMLDKSASLLDNLAFHSSLFPFFVLLAFRYRCFGFSCRSATSLPP